MGQKLLHLLFILLILISGVASAFFLYRGQAHERVSVFFPQRDFTTLGIRQDAGLKAELRTIRYARGNRRARLRALSSILFLGPVNPRLFPVTPDGIRFKSAQIGRKGEVAIFFDRKLNGDDTSALSYTFTPSTLASMEKALRVNFHFLGFVASHVVRLYVNGKSVASFSA